MKQTFSHQPASETIAVVGLGYVGLPVAVAFGKRARVIGFDINPRRIDELRSGDDRTGEVLADELKQAQIHYTCDESDLRAASCFIVTVPTPVDEGHRPDLGALLAATRTVGRALTLGDLVIYESTVYPGATEEECQPVLERESKLIGGRDFSLGYSPERINPGDREHTFTKIRKVVAADSSEALERVARIYESVVTAGVHRASSIKVAEAAKVIENTQRDLNIALINELALIFKRMGIDTHEVLAAAQTKWNFLPFKPGLVGGHCIGVDPYYLTYKSERLGYLPQVILAGRRINDGMGRYIAQNTVREMILAGKSVLSAPITILGLTFKENCPDIRNSRVIDVVRELETFGARVQVYDPYADPRETKEEYSLELCRLDQLQRAQAVIVAVAHREFREMSLHQLRELMDDVPVVIDVKGLFSPAEAARAGVRLWRL